MRLIWDWENVPKRTFHFEQAENNRFPYKYKAPVGLHVERSKSLELKSGSLIQLLTLVRRGVRSQWFIIYNETVLQWEPDITSSDITDIQYNSQGFSNAILPCYNRLSI